MLNLIRSFFATGMPRGLASFSAVLLVAVGIAHAQREFDPRISERMNILLGQPFDLAKDTIGLPDEHMKIGSNHLYTWTIDFNPSTTCIIQLEVSSKLFGLYTRVESYEIRGQDRACLEATENLEEARQVWQILEEEVWQ